MGFPLYLACFICGSFFLWVSDNPERHMKGRNFVVICRQIYLFMIVFGFSGILWTLQQWWFK